MVIKRMGVVSGPPLKCVECRQPFKPSIVFGDGKRRRAVGMKCSRCVKTGKATKKRRSQEGSAQ